MEDTSSNPLKKKRRFASLDILKGLVMVIMVLDHVRDFFHADVHTFDPADPILSNIPVFFTRWVTHFCAPTFVFLSGASIAFVASRKTTSETRAFLLSRGCWLMFCDAFIVSFLWLFDLDFDLFILGVIWVIGLAMVCSAFVFKLNSRILLGLALAIVVGHHSLDFLNHDNPNLLHAVLHQFWKFEFGFGAVFVAYPLLPWLGVMWGGIVLRRSCLTMTVDERLRWMKRWGITLTVGFVVVRLWSGYGNSDPWEIHPTHSGTLIDFFSPSKYPPSLAYLAMTLGPSMLILTQIENVKNQISQWLMVFGKVPFFFYLIHLLAIHVFAIPIAAYQGFGWDAMFLDEFVSLDESLSGYGFSLLGTYLIWAMLVVLLYRPSRWWMTYKRNHPEKIWLSYL